MSEMRFNAVTRDWVIIAEGRFGKPYEFDRRPSVRPTVERRDDCPFCPGNEGETSEGICQAEDESGAWQVRVVFNKYPALKPDSDTHREQHGTFLTMRAAGRHEVVIDHPRHDMTFASAGSEHLSRLLRVYRDRYIALQKLDHIENITIYRNHGVRAGVSLEHPHSQIVAAPIVPPQVRMRSEEAAHFHDETGECLFCRVLAEELEAKERIVEESDAFVGFVPHAALSPFHQWIYPRRHASSFDAIEDSEIDDLAEVLGRMAARLQNGIGDPDFNLCIRSAPVGEADRRSSHWYIALVPRILRLAGFEQGSGMYINPLRPERAAEMLRHANPE